MAVGHSGRRAANAGCSGALSSSTMTVTITAKTASENAASRCAVIFSSCTARSPVEDLTTKEALAHELRNFFETRCVSGNHEQIGKWMCPASPAWAHPLRTGNGRPGEHREVPYRGA